MIMLYNIINQCDIYNYNDYTILLVNNIVLINMNPKP